MTFCMSDCPTLHCSALYPSPVRKVEVFCGMNLATGSTGGATKVMLPSGRGTLGGEGGNEKGTAFIKNPYYRGFLQDLFRKKKIQINLSLK